MAKKEKMKTSIKLENPDRTKLVNDMIFNVDSLRLSQDFNSLAGVKKMITTVPVRKPNRQDFVRVHPSDDWQLQTAILELKEDREHYLVLKDMWDEIPGEITPKLLLTAINRQGVVFIWPVRLPGEDGRLDNWNHSALEAAEHAKKKWVRVAANMSLGAYDVFEAVGELPEPLWPETTFKDLLITAFKDRVIDSPDHPVLKRLAGVI
ncbi:hypothetical protein [Desulfonatronospira sp.]|uniref:hypothetical protein n=1 Tax=Desulfonatronospira sp. TaxID=1962951 RepID=UPI0025B95C6D|nr:hypothetical protein [Desulfonatronospira sp.]